MTRIDIKYGDGAADKYRFVGGDFLRTAIRKDRFTAGSGDLPFTTVFRINSNIHEPETSVNRKVAA